MTLIATPAQVLDCINENVGLCKQFGCSIYDAIGAIRRLRDAGLVDSMWQLTDAGRAALSAAGDGSVG